MAKETKEVVTELNEETGEVTTEVIETEVDEVEEKTEEVEFIPTGLEVFRRKYKKDGKDRYSFHTPRKMRRGDITCDWLPSDIGGYEQLDMVFFEKDIKTALPLYSVTSSFKDSAGKKVSTTSYYVRDYDEIDRVWYMAKIKPAEASDKGNLATLLDLASRD